MSQEKYFNRLIAAFREIEVTWQSTVNKHLLDSKDIDTINLLMHQTQILINNSTNAAERKKCWKNLIILRDHLFIVDLCITYA
jgi:hypothetical protein